MARAEGGALSLRAGRTNRFQDLVILGIFEEVAQRAGAHPFQDIATGGAQPLDLDFALARTYDAEGNHAPAFDVLRCTPRSLVLPSSHHHVTAGC